MTRGFAPWPSPKPLEGVKSRHRSIFEIVLGGLEGGDTQQVSRVSGLKLCLDSRICASGASGKIAVDLFLGRGRQLASGKAVRHESLRVAHLGPHLAGVNSSSDEHAAAIAEEMSQRPHVVVLDEANSEDDSAWDEVFSALIAEEQLFCQFHGAVVFFVSEETPVVSKICTSQWSGSSSWLWQEPMVTKLKIVEDVSLANEDLSVASDQCSEAPSFLEEVTSLSKQVFFGEDTVEKARDRGWAMTLLIEDECSENPKFCGFMCHSVNKNKAEFHIARIAVIEQSRGKGYGRTMMQWALDKAGKMPRNRCKWISLSALDEAVPFYEQFGFMDMTCDNLEEDEHIQTWMELKNISVVPDEESDSEDEDESADESEEEEEE
eukprot:TRINITY_DN3882_c1_g2_i1.p1 TRINITY_DN3882_c1_g2~~TRINITY_DN3882_c1_g2_i1.p1  ORF type:complete len:378 (+),score=78.60 TRINITY_DN3882_c1_g2_i1:43-1176(+)